MDGKQRKNINTAFIVEIVQKSHQRTGQLTKGIVAKILTKSANHPHGIKVQLETGFIGRVKNILE
ncbi:MAG: YwbE family protein [Polaribacter sp.]|nr:YwbE family protein [Polaribacter sp.]